jgi:hypothetical protein
VSANNTTTTQSDARTPGAEGRDAGNRALAADLLPDVFQADVRSNADLASTAG